jgi:hypothetical protein
LHPSGHSVTVVSPEMLQRADVIVHDDHSITTQQLALILSINKVTYLRSLIFKGMRKMGSSEPHSQTQNREKSHFFQIVGTF